MIKENKTTIQINLTVVCSLLVGFVMFFVGHSVGYESALKPINKITYTIKLGEQTISVINPDGTVI